MSKKRQYFERIVIYCIGLMFVALGVAISINSNLGVSPVNSLPYVTSLITGVELGTCIVIVFTGYILLQVLILRSEFQWINLTQIIFSFLFGFFTDFSKWLLRDFVIPTYAGKLVMLLMSILLIAFGISLYVNAKLVNMPMEGVTDTIAKKILKGKPFHEVKVMVDCVVVAAAAIGSVIFLGRLEGVREGTVISAFLVGRFMKPIQTVLIPIMEKRYRN